MFFNLVLLNMPGGKKLNLKCCNEKGTGSLLFKQTKKRSTYKLEALTNLFCLTGPKKRSGKRLRIRRGRPRDRFILNGRRKYCGFSLTDSVIKLNCNSMLWTRTSCIVAAISERKSV